MKICKLAVAGVLALASLATASATTTIHIIGSTAYRAAVNDAIRKVLNVTSWAIVAPDTTDTSLGGSSEGWWSGTLKAHSGDGTVVIKTFFTGSIAGVADLCIPHTITGFIADGQGSPSGAALGSGYTQDPAEDADFAWTDTDAGTDALVLQKGNTGAITGKDAIQGQTLDEAGTLAPSAGEQGIVFFELVGEALTTGSSFPIQSLSTDNLATMITKGYISMAQLTGTTTNSNQTNDIFLIGRNEDSGSRGNVYADAFEGYNIGSNTAVQFMPGYSGGTIKSYNDTGASASYITTTGSNLVYDGGTATSLSSLQEWPSGWALNTDSSISWTSLGHSGFISGSEVAAALSATDPIIGVSVNIAGVTNTPNQTYVVGYVAGTDAATALTAPAHATELQYNGVTYSQAGVLNGTYGLWGYEHAYYIDGSASTIVDAANDISDYVYQFSAEDNASCVQDTTDRSASGIFIPATPLVVRGGPGQPITEKYAP